MQVSVYLLSNNTSMMTSFYAQCLGCHMRDSFEEVGRRVVTLYSWTLRVPEILILHQFIKLITKIGATLIENICI